MRTKGSINLIDEVKEKARVLLTEGYSINSISKRLGISRNSVRTARDEKDNLDGLRQNKKEEIIKKLWDIAKNALEHITDEKLKKSHAYQVMMISAIAIDKAQLLSGGATERLELSRSEIDHKLNELEIAERELKEAWERARKERGKAAEGGKQIPKDSTNEH
jgi:23S rRNA maturation-related 3'-5' exoribonuclease YhaM